MLQPTSNKVYRKVLPMTTEDTTPTNDNIPYFQNPQLIEVAGPILADAFEQRVYALLENAHDFRSFVALKYFKNELLADVFATAGGKLLAELILNQMIKDGRLEVGKVKNPHSEYPTSTIRKA